ncbi:hypothetical protein, partial [Neisseria sicca]
FQIKNTKGRLKSLSDDLYHKYPKQFQIYRASTYNLEPPHPIPVTFLNSIHVSIMTYLIQIGLSCCNE